MNQPLHQSLTNPRTTAPQQRRGKRRRNTTSSPLLIAALSTTALSLPTNAQIDHTCPPGKNGWAATSDCRQYYWCSAGSTSGMVYTCPDSTQYNVATSVCENPASFSCVSTPSPVVVTDSPTETTPPGELLEAMTTAILGEGGMDVTAIPVGGSSSATAPTNYPTKLGPPLYYGDFRTSSCLSAAADPTVIAAGVGIPSWLTEDLMYPSKEECCMDMFGWAPLENCLGEGWVETNYVRGSHSPTMSPSMMPTGVPSGMPSGSVMPSRWVFFLVFYRLDHSFDLFSLQRVDIMCFITFLCSLFAVNPPLWPAKYHQHYPVSLPQVCQV